MSKFVPPKFLMLDSASNVADLVTCNTLPKLRPNPYLTI